MNSVCKDVSLVLNKTELFGLGMSYCVLVAVGSGEIPHGASAICYPSLSMVKFFAVWIENSNYSSLIGYKHERINESS